MTLLVIGIVISIMCETFMLAYYDRYVILVEKAKTNPKIITSEESIIILGIVICEFIYMVTMIGMLMTPVVNIYGLVILCWSIVAIFRDKLKNKDIKQRLFMIDNIICLISLFAALVTIVY